MSRMCRDHEKCKHFFGFPPFLQQKTKSKHFCRKAYAFEKLCVEKQSGFWNYIVNNYMDLKLFFSQLNSIVLR